MIIAEIKEGNLPSFLEFSEPAFMRLSVLIAFKHCLDIPESLPECLTLWRMTADEVLTFATWEEAAAWANTTDRPDKPWLVSCINLADRRRWRAGALSVYQAG